MRRALVILVPGGAVLVALGAWFARGGAPRRSHPVAAFGASSAGPSAPMHLSASPRTSASFPSSAPEAVAAASAGLREPTDREREAAFDAATGLRPLSRYERDGLHGADLERRLRQLDLTGVDLRAVPPPPSWWEEEREALMNRLLAETKSPPGPPDQELLRRQAEYQRAWDAHIRRFGATRLRELEAKRASILGKKDAPAR